MCAIGGVIKLDKRKTFNIDTQLTSIALFKEMQNRGDHAWGIYLEKKKGNKHLDCGKEDLTVPGELFKMPESFTNLLHKLKGIIYLNNTQTMLLHTILST